MSGLHRTRRSMRGSRRALVGGYVAAGVWAFATTVALFSGHYEAAALLFFGTAAVCTGWYLLCSDGARLHDHPPEDDEHPGSDEQWGRMGHVMRQRYLRRRRLALVNPRYRRSGDH